MECTAADQGTPAELFTPAGYARLFATPRGRAFHLRWMAHAEEADEGVFDQLLLRVDVPELHKMVAIHVDDEKRHASLLRACASRIGVAAEPIPDDLRYIERLRRMSGGGDLAAIFANGTTSIMHIFAMLQVVEERGVRQFPLVEDALRRVDTESADVVAAITRDERRHVQYARAISRRYAPDETSLEQVLTLCRQVEALAFADNEGAYLRFATERGFLADARA
jgi:rubrerythrin